MNIDAVLEAAAALCLITGALMSLAAAIGMLRFPDLLSRMHAATKPQVFGLLMLLLGLALQLRSWAAVPVLVVAWLFQLLTVPVSAHMVGRAGYRTKHLRKDTLSIDELDEVVRKAAEEEGVPDRGTGEPAFSNSAVGKELDAAAAEAGLAAEAAAHPDSHRGRPGSAGAAQPE
ncbi:monovalent cation/proton antiporter subunit MnhG/PhaG [Arthrobacter crystallopoietes BAB-32]|uniref:Monovalent cation/proton antiporter subunit MnhG/PhaG n=1 Tax=Arthrobacter crystallopoietes BAB-32 TaxID=1246476 RepID=N1UQ64_9MICC|nr:monovalent cation/proton antiporter subunit MnhG/PhaG [Arthrobacter crystallopoietes BAB-32]